MSLEHGPESAHLHHVIDRNVRALEKAHQRSEDARSIEQRLADRVASFAGSMWSVYFHIVFFGSWFAINLGLVPGVEPFDPYPFVMLAMWASVEAIFLSTFVLINQNRMGDISERRADLDLQVSLLTEHELTRLIRIVDSVGKKLGVDVEAAAGDIDEIKQDVKPETVLARLDSETDRSNTDR